MAGMMLAVAGGGGLNISLTARTISDPSVNASGSQYILNNDGTADFQRTVGTDGTYAGEWAPYVIPSAIAALYEVVVSLVSGTLSVGAAGTFNLGTTRTFGVSAGAGATKSCTISVTIQRAGGGAVEAGPVNIALSCGS